MQSVDGLTNSNRHLLVAFVCGLAPLLIGCGIFILWCATSWRWLQAAGFFNIFFGLACCVIGAIFLAVYFLEVLRQRPLSFGKLIGGLLAAGIMTLNFPTCVAIIAAVIRLEGAQSAAEPLRQSYVTVINSGNSPLESIKLPRETFDTEVGPLAPGEGTSLPLVDSENAMLYIRWDDQAEPMAFDLPKKVDRTENIVVIVKKPGEIEIVPVFSEFYDPTD